MKRKKLIVGNWKMNGARAAVAPLIEQVRVAAADSSGVEVALCVPFPFLETAERLLADSTLAWGAQDLSEHASGAHTGEVSAQMLKDFGCRYVIVGHSERRSDHGESDQLVLSKVRAALDQSLTPIICVGETLIERGADRTEEVVLSQVKAALEPLSPEERRRCVLAYEPVWAIGTGLSASPAQAEAVHATVRSWIATLDADLAADMRILYGGSVKPESASALFGQDDIDGGLIGGASLVASDFRAIIAAA